MSTITGRWPLVFWTKSLSTYLAASELHIKMFYSYNKGNNKNITNKEFDKLFPVSHLCLLFAYLGVEIFEFRGQKKTNHLHWQLSEFLEQSFIYNMNEWICTLVHAVHCQCQADIFFFSCQVREAKQINSALWCPLGFCKTSDIEDCKTFCWKIFPAFRFWERVWMGDFFTATFAPPQAFGEGSWRAILAF